MSRRTAGKQHITDFEIIQMLTDLSYGNPCSDDYESSEEEINTGEAYSEVLYKEASRSNFSSTSSVR